MTYVKIYTKYSNEQGQLIAHKLQVDQSVNLQDHNQMKLLWMMWEKDNGGRWHLILYH